MYTPSQADRATFARHYASPGLTARAIRKARQHHAPSVAKVIEVYGRDKGREIIQQRPTPMPRA